MDAYTARLMAMTGVKRENPLWYTGIHSLGAQSNGPSLENAMALAATGAQGTPDQYSAISPAQLQADGISTDEPVDPANQQYVFVANMLCCPQCSEMNGRTASGMQIAVLPHPNCRCAWVPADEAATMNRNNMAMLPQGRSLRWTIGQLRDENSNYNNMMAGRNSATGGVG